MLACCSFNGGDEVVEGQKSRLRSGRLNFGGVTQTFANRLIQNVKEDIWPRLRQISSLEYPQSTLMVGGTQTVPSSYNIPPSSIRESHVNSGFQLLPN